MSDIDRVRLAALAQRAAWWAFIAVVVLSPFRARIELVARPATPVYGDYTNFLLFLSDIAVLVTLVLWLLSLGDLGRQFGGSFRDGAVGGLRRPSRVVRHSSGVLRWPYDARERPPGVRRWTSAPASCTPHASHLPRGARTNERHVPIRPIRRSGGIRWPAEGRNR